MRIGLILLQTCPALGVESGNVHLLIGNCQGIVLVACRGYDFEGLLGVYVIQSKDVVGRNKKARG